jgi:hypothetical protein
MAALFADENFPLPAVERLLVLGHNVLTMLQLETAGQAIPDEEVLALATSLNRCLLTLNRKDFIKLHNHQPLHSGILICTFDSNFTALADRIHTCLTEATIPLDGQLLRVQRLQT